MRRLYVALLLACALSTAACNSSKPAAPDNTAQNAAPNAPADSGTTANNSRPASAATAPVAEPKPAPEPPPPPPVVPAGTSLTIRLGSALSSKGTQAGQSFNGTLSNSVSVDGKTVIPAGSPVSGTVVSAKAKGKVSGEGELSLALTNVAVKGTDYSITTQTWSQVAKGKGKRTAATTGGGAAVGALIGGLAGGGKGAAIGAGVGAGAGFAGGTLTGNSQVELPAESSVTFVLSAPLTLK